MTYKKLLFNFWLKNCCREILFLIPISAIIAFVAKFFTNVLFDLGLHYLILWRWTYIVYLCNMFIKSLRSVRYRWKADHFLADQWLTTPEAILDADVNLKLFGKSKLEEVRMMYDRNEFLAKYRTARDKKYPMRNGEFLAI